VVTCARHDAIFDRNTGVCDVTVELIEMVQYWDLDQTLTAIGNQSSKNRNEAHSKLSKPGFPEPKLVTPN
jgi:hypothetical protein